MAKKAARKKTEKAKSEKVVEEPKVEEPKVEEPKVEEPKVEDLKPSGKSTQVENVPAEKVPKEPKTETVQRRGDPPDVVLYMLTEGSTYQVAGMTFHRDRPVPVSNPKVLSRIRRNSRFKVIRRKERSA